MKSAPLVIVEPDRTERKVTSRNSLGELELVYCDCDCATKCPNGHLGSAPRCAIWKLKSKTSPR